MKRTDAHVHLAAIPTPDNGCRLSRRMRLSPNFRAIAWIHGLPLNDPEAANRRYVERLQTALKASEFVDRAVLLAMDGTYDSAGRLNEERTDLLISNDYLFSVVRGSPDFLAGISVNPMRQDAVDELERCASLGACLVKTLPNAQGFDPADRRHVPYYRAMARLGLPLLSHVGFEFALIGQDQSVGDPNRLRPALDEGVTVIAAHGCSYGWFVYEKYLDRMLDLVRRYPNFYVDTSALTFPNRLGMLFHIRRHPEIWDRLVFGTDYPVPVLAYGRAAGAKTSFDRHVRALESFGVPPGRDVCSLMKHRAMPGKPLRLPIPAW